MSSSYLVQSSPKLFGNMKWVIFVSLLCFLSFAELKNLPRRYRHTDPDICFNQMTISLASQIPTYDFGAIVLGLFAQSIPNATLEEVQKQTANVKAIHQKCVDNEYSSPECTKPLGIVFLDVLCHDEEFSKKYGINDCCAKADPERNECALSHKISSIGSVSSFVHPSAEEACQAYHNNRNAVLASHLYEISRRNPTAPINVLSAATKSFDKILETCCEEVEKDTCIEKKAAEVRKKAREIIDEQENTCFNLNNYGKETLYALKFIETAEKFINANLETITHIAKDVVHIHEETCKGDSMEATLDRAALSQYVCEHKDAISSNLDHCCGETLVERPQCIVTLENDARSPDLPPPSGEILKETEACTSYRENATEYKESFLFALIRNHPELSKLIDLEILHKYEELLEKCCKLDDHVECLHTGEEEIKLYITKINDVVKNNCKTYEDIGRSNIQNFYLTKYSKIILQAPNYYLIEFTKKLAKVAEKCCKLDSDHQVSCALENVDKVIGSVCRYHKEHFTNKQVCHCCGSSFISRWECISNLGPDPSYVPLPFKPKALDAPENLCSPNEETMQESSQSLLIDLIKSKPNIIEKEVAYGMLFFHELQKSCCAADNEEECSDILQRVKNWLNRVVFQSSKLS